MPNTKSGDKEDVLPELADVNVCSKADLKDGFLP